MLNSNFIPIYQDEPADWQKFLYKASRGSVKAIDILDHAGMAYMVAVTGDNKAPENLELNDYYELLKTKFPLRPPDLSFQELHDLAVVKSWFPHSFLVSNKFINPRDKYVNLWRNSSATWIELANDAMVLCLSEWSASRFVEYVADNRPDYDALQVVTAMLFMSLTWPDINELK